MKNVKPWYKKWWGILLIIFFGPSVVMIPIIIIMQITGNLPDPPKKPAIEKVVVKELTPEQKKIAEAKILADKIIADKQAREEMIAKQFSAWDGKHIGLTRLIKSSMNDPASFEHIESKYWEQDDHIIVLESFRGKNAFGGLVVNSVKAKVSFDGNDIKIIE